MRFPVVSGSLYGVPKSPHVVRPVPAHVVSRVPVHVVGPVTVSRDGWDWAAFWIAAVSGLAAVIAIGIAVAAIKWATRIGRDADMALIRERQLTFELGVLVRIAETETLSPPGAVSALSALVAALPDGELPLHRSSLNKGSVPNAQTLTTGAPNEILAELIQAIESRKIETGPPRLMVRRTIRQTFGWRTESNSTAHQSDSSS